MLNQRNMNLYSDHNLELKCQVPGHKQEVACFILLDKIKVGKDRWKCAICLEENLEKFHKIIEIKHVLSYAQNGIELDEFEDDRLSSKFPLNSILQAKFVSLLTSSQEEQPLKFVENYFQSFNKEVKERISLMRQKGKEQSELIKQLFEELKEKFFEIIDCTILKQIIKEYHSESELEENTYQFLKKKMESEEFNSVLNSLNDQLETNLKYFSQDLFTFILQQSEQEISKIQFDLGQSLSSLQCNYTLPLNQYHQLAIEIEILDLPKFLKDPIQKIYIGLFSRDSKDFKQESEQYWLCLSGKKSTLGCFQVQYGEDLSIIKQSKQVIIMHFCIRKNVFYFSNSDKTSRNIHPAPICFNQSFTMIPFIDSNQILTKVRFIDKKTKSLEGTQ